MIISSWVARIPCFPALSFPSICHPPSTGLCQPTPSPLHHHSASIRISALALLPCSSTIHIHIQDRTSSPEQSSSSIFKTVGFLAGAAGCGSMNALDGVVGFGFGGFLVVVEVVRLGDKAKFTNIIGIAGGLYNL